VESNSKYNLMRSFFHADQEYGSTLKKLKANLEAFNFLRSRMRKYFS